MKTVQTTGIVSWIFLLFLTLSGWAQPDTRFFLIQPGNEAIARIYTGLLDRDIQSSLSTFNPDNGLVQVRIPDSASTQNSGLLQAEESLRYSAHLAEALGYAYSLKSSLFYRSDEALQTVQTLFNTYKDQHAQWNPRTVSPSSEREMTQSAYRLEAWMTAFALMGKDMPEDDRKRIDAMLQEELDTLARMEPYYADHQNMVWCGVMAMATRFTGDTRYMEQAKTRLKNLLPRVFQQDGQVLENGDMDIQNALLSLTYLYLYRVLSDDEDVDEPMVRGLDWAARMCSLHGLPLSAPTGEHQNPNRIPVANLLGALTDYGSRHERFNLWATRYLEGLIEAEATILPRFSPGHFLRGMANHSKPQHLDEIPYRPYSRRYQSPLSDYFVFGSRYQTLITLKSINPAKGLQTWSYKGQPPIIAPAPQTASHVLGFGVDSAKVNRDDRSPVQHTRLADQLESLVYKQNELITGIVFANDLMVVIYRDGYENGWVDWVMGTPLTMIQDNRVLFDKTEARIFLPPVPPVLLEREGRQVARFPYKSGMIWFTFAGPESVAVVQPVMEGVVLMQLNDAGKTLNLVINLSQQAFTKNMSFPGTKIPVPPIDAFGAALVNPSKE